MHHLCFYIDERASLARATRVAVHFIFVLGPSALCMVLFVNNNTYLPHVVDNIIFGEFHVRFYHVIEFRIFAVLPGILQNCYSTTPL